MFSTLMLDFEERVREVDLFFTVLAGAENGELAVVKGTGPQVIPGNLLPADWVPITAIASKSP